MSPTKRRKLEHDSDGDRREDTASFASFESYDSDNDLRGHLQNDVRAEIDEDTEGASLDSDIEMSGTDTEEQTIDTRSSKSTPQLSRETRRHSKPSSTQTGAFDGPTAGSFKSTVFKLQVDDLIEQVRPKHGTRELAAEEALRELKTTLEKMPAHELLPIGEAERSLLMSNKVATPFPIPRPPIDAQYKLAFVKPSSIDVAGSYALKTAPRLRNVFEIDLVVTMPGSLLQDKDYLNHRYFYKRAYYVARIAAVLEKLYARKYQMRFCQFRGDRLKPILIISPPREEVDTKGKGSAAAWAINVIPCIGSDTFPSEKLLLDKICFRSGTDAKSSKGDKARVTSFYNSSLRADMLVTDYLKTMHFAVKSCPAYQEACLLGSTWLRQRGLGSDVQAGGFGNFEWSCLLALLLQGGESRDTPFLSSGYSSYQMFKAALQLLALRDVRKQPLTIGVSSGAFSAAGNPSPIIWDGKRQHNILYKMTMWSYGMLRLEAKTAISTLSDQSYDSFDSLFILRSDRPLYRYDCTFTMDPTSLADSTSGPYRSPLQHIQGLYDVLRQGLGERTEQIFIHSPEPGPWSISSAEPPASRARIVVGVTFVADKFNRNVDLGPLVENKAAVEEFRRFWGGKAELRRFKDGSIRESLVWSSKEGGQSIIEQIIRHLVRHHVDQGAEESVTFTGRSLEQLRTLGFSSTALQDFTEGFRQLETDIRGLSDLPLSVRQISPAGSQLRHASTAVYKPFERRTPADVIIQFEGSGRWPDDLVAIQRTKIAFLLRLGELLGDSVTSVSARVGLENQDQEMFNQGFLDIVYESGCVFRLRIYHDREQTLFERQLKDKSLDPRTMETAAGGLAKHKRDYVRSPAHTTALNSLCGKHPALGGTIIVTKRWFASHLLLNHLAEEVIELLVARTFVQPWPWRAPSSVQTGFLRTLFFLSRWDWRAEPLIVDLSSSSEITQPQFQSITTAFDAWRKLDPSLHRVVLFAASNVDHDGTTWTDRRPEKVVAARMTALAKAATAEIQEKGLELVPEALFVSPLTDFDFVLQLNPAFMGKKRRQSSSANGIKYKNLEMSPDDQSLVGYDPLADLLDELEGLYGEIALFFSGGSERAIIAGLWRPQSANRTWKLNIAGSTIPKRVADDEVLAEINKEGILSEIATLGGDLIVKIDMKK